MFLFLNVVKGQAHASNSNAGGGIHNCPGFLTFLYFGSVFLHHSIIYLFSSSSFSLPHIIISVYFSVNVTLYLCTTSGLYTDLYIYQWGGCFSLLQMLQFTLYIGFHFYVLTFTQNTCCPIMMSESIHLFMVLKF